MIICVIESSMLILILWNEFILYLWIMTLYAYFILMIGQTKVDNYCQNAFWQPKTEVTVELCEQDVWMRDFPNAYILK